MKKLLLLVIPVFLLTGCGGETEDVACTINGDRVVFTLKNGLVSKGTLNGERIKSADIANLNDEYFLSATNNEEGKEALYKYAESVNGSCN